MIKIFLIVLFIMLGVAGWVTACSAEEDFHPAEHRQLHHEFYSNWMRPDHPNQSCCNLQDCAPVSEIRKIGNRWEARRENDGAWLVIPPQKIEQQRDSPDGRSHLCSRDATVFCFVFGAGT